MAAPAKKTVHVRSKASAGAKAATGRTSQRAKNVASDAKPKAATPSVKRARATVPADFKTSMLNIRVRDRLKIDATRTLAEIGISLPEAVRVFLGRIVSEKAFPFHLEVPNAETRAAMHEANQLKGRFATAQELFDDLEKGGAR